MEKKKIGIIVGVILGIGLVIASFSVKPKSNNTAITLSNDMNVILANAE